MVRRVMVMAWMLVAGTCFAQQVDMRFLDKLAAKASEKTEINMDEAMLKSATGLLNDNEQAEALAKKTSKDLRALFLRSYGFDAKGAFTQDDLRPLLDQLKGPAWKLFLKNEEGDEMTQIWMHYTNGAGDGMLLISSEEDELTVINAVGTVNLADFGALGTLANLGVRVPRTPVTKDEE